MKLNRSLVAAAALAVYMPLVADAQQNGVTPHNWTDAGATSGYTIGYQFNILSSVYVTGLSYFDVGQDGLGAAHDVGLWANNGSLLASTTVAAGTGATLLGDFRVANLSTALLLNPGTYRVGGTIEGDDFAYAVGPQYGGNGYITNAPGIQWTDYALHYGTGLADPDNFANDGEDYAYFGGGIVVGEEVTPEPASLVLLGTGLVGIVGFARRKKSAARV